jgi:hypothetical protein
MQQRLKPKAGLAGAQIVSPEFFQEFLVSVHDPVAAFDSGL